MSREILLLVDVLAREKNLDQEVVFQALEEALAATTKKSLDVELDIAVKINRNSGKYKTFRVLNVVPDQQEANSATEVNLCDAKQHDKHAAVGHCILLEIDNVDFGRISIKQARGIIAHKIRQAGREQVLHDYLSRNKGIISGKIRSVEHGNVIVDCGKVDAVILKNQLIPNEVLTVGSTIRGFVDKANLVIRQNCIVISRTDPRFVKALMKLHIPELASEKIEVIDIARAPGIRSKVAVVSHDPRIDPKSACIGFANQRISSIKEELFTEEIDIVIYDDNISRYIVNALAPAAIEGIVIDEDHKTVDVIVKAENLGMAIGTNGVNVSLAAQLVKHKINILDEEQASTKRIQNRSQVAKFFMTELDIDENIANILVDHDFTIEEIATVDIEEMLTVEDFNHEIAEELQNRAKKYINNKILSLQEELESIMLVDSKSVLTKSMLLRLVNNDIATLQDFADSTGDTIKNLIGIEIKLANQLVLAAREKVGLLG